jgi:hypothetical protein
MKPMDFFVWQGAGGVNSELFTTSATRPGGKRHGFMVRYGLGLVLHTPASRRASPRRQYSTFMRANMNPTPAGGNMLLEEWDDHPAMPEFGRFLRELDPQQVDMEAASNLLFQQWRMFDKA